MNMECHLYPQIQRGLRRQSHYSSSLGWTLEMEVWRH